jgi:hypothetical protein
MVKNPLKIQEKNSKKNFFGNLSRYLIPFYRAKKFFKIFLTAFGTRYYSNFHENVTFLRNLVNFCEFLSKRIMDRNAAA